MLILDVYRIVCSYITNIRDVCALRTVSRNIMTMTHASVTNIVVDRKLETGILLKFNDLQRLTLMGLKTASDIDYFPRVSKVVYIDTHFFVISKNKHILANILRRLLFHKQKWEQISLSYCQINSKTPQVVLRGEMLYYYPSNCCEIWEIANLALFFQKVFGNKIFPIVIPLCSQLDLSDWSLKTIAKSPKKHTYLFDCSPTWYPYFPPLTQDELILVLKIVRAKSLRTLSPSAALQMFINTEAYSGLEEALVLPETQKCRRGPCDDRDYISDNDKESAPVSPENSQQLPLPRHDWGHIYSDSDTSSDSDGSSEYPHS